MLIEAQHFRLIGPTGAVAEHFQNADEDSIYGKLYKHNMLGLKSFFSTVDGLELLEKGDKVAFFINGAKVRARKDYHCKVNISCHIVYDP